MQTTSLTGGFDLKRIHKINRCSKKLRKIVSKQEQRRAHPYEKLSYSLDRRRWNLSKTNFSKI